MLLKRFLLKDTDINKACYIWNFIYSFWFGFQSVIILMVLTRTVGLDETGIFTIAYSNATLFLFVGKYGVRNYQVSDVTCKHSFGDYLESRYISVLAMLFVSLAYVLYCTSTRGYSFEKFQIIMWVGVSKIPDAVEDVYAGEYQKQGRLDVALKMMSIRIMLSVLTLCFLVVCFNNLLQAIIISTIISFVMLWVVIRLTIPVFSVQRYKNFSSIKKIFMNCFPIFAGTFLNQYINNAPKYAIDANMTDEVQACYGFIAMPVFVIGLFSNVVLQPAVYNMAENWIKHKRDIFLRQFWRQIRVVLVLTIIAVVGAWFIGCPALSILYNTDLSEYRYEMLVLLVGGGFLAISQVLNTVITIIRKQSYLLSGYLFVALLAAFYSNKLVTDYGIEGVAGGYMAFMAILTLVFSLIFWRGIKENG